eukprot:s2465_g3.t1
MRRGHRRGTGPIPRQLRQMWTAGVLRAIYPSVPNARDLLDPGRFSFLVQWLMRWRLHPVHRSKSKGSEILQNCAARNVEELDRCVSRLARQHFETVAIEEEIELSSSSLLLSQNSQLMLRIPLLLADITYQWVSQAPGGLSSYILGVLPRSRQSGSRSLWVFSVGPCSMKDFNEHLWNFGRHGAVRRDVHSALALTSTVLGAGGCGKVFLANKWDATGEYIDTNLAVKELLPKGKPVECTLRTEIEFLSAAQGHPNVAILHGVFHQLDCREEGENVFKAPGSPEEVLTQEKEVVRDRWLIALQLYTSGDLFERVQRSGPLKEAESAPGIVVTPMIGWSWDKKCRLEMVVK